MRPRHGIISMNTSLFIVAHPDDDLMVWPLMRDLSATHRIVVIYTTDTQATDGGRRRSEAQKTLSVLPIHETHIVESKDISTDGRTIDLAADIASRIEIIAEQHAPVTQVTTHALEGGNPDHDLAFCIGSGLASRLEVSSGDRVVFRAVPFYRKHPVGALPFTVHRPLPGMPHENFRSSRIRNLMILPAARHYRSQIFVLLALLPLFVLKLCLRGGVLFHSERKAEAYIQRIENTSMIGRAYDGEPSDFYERLMDFWNSYRPR